MISIYKLEKLHRSQRLRKIASIFASAERRLIVHLDKAGSTIAAQTSAKEYAYLSDIARSLVGDSLFAQHARDLFVGAAEIFAQAATPSTSADPATTRRALNGARHALLAETGRSQADWDFLDGDGRLDPARRQTFRGMLVFLDDVRSPFNVGAMFRSAESFGAEKIFLSPLCADPTHPRALRTAMGCVDALPWERADFFPAQSPASPAALAGAPVFALETGGAPLAEFPFPERGIMVVGSEELGASPQALAAADASLGRVSIPCYGAKGSLNASVAFGIAMQAWASRLALGSQGERKSNGAEAGA